LTQERETLAGMVGGGKICVWCGVAVVKAAASRRTPRGARRFAEKRGWGKEEQKVAGLGKASPLRG
jgi:hypothetical protein